LLNLYRQEFAPPELSIPGWRELDKTRCRFMDAIKQIWQRSIDIG
jgi:hypothetical protein